MQSNLLYVTMFLRLQLGVLLTAIPTSFVVASTEPQSTREMIEHLLGADEFKAEERELMQALPIEAVPMLTEELKKIPLDANHTRQFYLLAAKVAQFESNLRASILDDAVNALLVRIKPVHPLSNSEMTNLRLKLGKLAGIKDQRINEAIHLVRVALEEEKSTHAAADVTHDQPKGNTEALPKVQPSLHPETLKTKSAAQSDEHPASTALAVWAMMIVAAIGLLWLVLKKRK